MSEEELNKEKEYLSNILNEIDGQIFHTQNVIEKSEKEMEELTHHFSEEYYNIDDTEKNLGGAELDKIETLTNQEKLHYYKLKRQRLSPYFGKITFKSDDLDSIDDLYIGVLSLTDDNNKPLICDWRAPVSSLFYDFETGKAFYNAPVGTIKGEIFNKRQFKIKNSKMEYCFDSDLTIQDNILQQELANNANQKMKNIVSTIQKEQNIVIRDKSKTLFVQGIAGSGKTSIALHRVAYLLYQYKDKIKSSDILILSPNMVFSDYISNVLPSLGEENIQSLSFYDIAKDELNGMGLLFQTREDELDELAEKADRLNEVAYKNSFEFCDSLKEYLKTYVNMSINAHDLKFGDVKIKKEKIEELYNQKYIDKSPYIRINWIADYIMDQLLLDGTNEELLDRIKRVLYPMFIQNNLLEYYIDFLNKIGMNFSLSQNNKIRNEDIAPLLYIKNYIMGINKLKDVKYLVIDEMQDYSPIHYELFNDLFDCDKTVLGDIYQCLEKVINKSELDKYAKLIGAKEILELNKTYRSTYEIVDFADKIKGLSSNKVERHGQQPHIEICENIENEAKYIENLIKNTKKYETIAIICKTRKQAELYYSYINGVENLKLMDENSEISSVMIMPASMCKGLEFDMVILPNVSEENYKSFLDKNLLYVSSTRALHELYLTTNKKITRFLK